MVLFIFSKNKESRNEVLFQDLFVVESNEQVGRYTVAKQDLKAGDIIFTEKPFAYGPKSGNFYID